MVKINFLFNSKLNGQNLVFNTPLSFFLCSRLARSRIYNVNNHEAKCSFANCVYYINFLFLN